MPRASVHAQRDLPLVVSGLSRLGTRPREEVVEEALLARHKAIDKNQDEEDQVLHFMRGPEEEHAAEAVARALGHIERRARAAVPLLARFAAAPDREGALLAALKPLTDACHAVRDSYSRGHATRKPGPGGPVVAEIRSWESEKAAGRGFGLGHALLRDARFEWPFARTSPEIPASDAAVAALVTLVVHAADAGEDGFDRAWARFVGTYFVPPPDGTAENEEDNEDPDEDVEPSVLHVGTRPQVGTHASR